MNIFVYILGRIPPTIFVSSAKWIPILQSGWLWCHSMQMVCTEYSVCVECTVCILWKKLHRIELHKYCKKTSWTVGGELVYWKTQCTLPDQRPKLQIYKIVFMTSETWSIWLPIGGWLCLWHHKYNSLCLDFWSQTWNP